MGGQVDEEAHDRVHVKTPLPVHGQAQLQVQQPGHDGQSQRPSVKQQLAQGFTLLEVLIALAVGSVLMLGATRTLPLLVQHNQRLLMQVQLQEELQQIAWRLGKALQRTGYCHGQCAGPALRIRPPPAACLLLRWDENSNGRWEEPGRDNSEWWGYRLRAGNLEMQRGVASCEGPGWEKLNDPAQVGIRQFAVTREGRQFRLLLSAFAVAWPAVTLTLDQRVSAENL